MIVINLITKSGFERREFQSADYAQNYINSRSDVLGFRCTSIPSKKTKRLIK